MKKLDDIKKVLLDRGFRGIKLELEAQVTMHNSTVECGTCEGAGSTPCTYCNNRNECPHCHTVVGEVVQICTCFFCRALNYCALCNGQGVATCDQCQNSGRRTCVDCRGNGNIEDEYCEPHASVREHFKLALKDLPIHYWRAYNDGSVNTEITLTIATENLHHLPAILKTFVQACDKVGEWNTDRAGMHITLMTSTHYPTDTRLNSFSYENYLNAMQPLIQGLYVLSSEDLYTRSIEFRHPVVSDEQKYSAIFTHEDTALEFRIFDTCYNKPKRILAFMAVIANTLDRFYNPERNVEVYKKIYALTSLGNSRLNLRRMDNTYRYVDQDEFRQVMELLHPNPSLISSFGNSIRENITAIVESLDTVANELAA